VLPSTAGLESGTMLPAMWKVVLDVVEEQAR